MLFYCGNCKTVLREDELEEYEESRGEYLGSPCWETFMVCPICGVIPREYIPPCEDEEEGEEYEGLPRETC